MAIITPAEFAAVVVAAPAPSGTQWEHDHRQGRAGDRVRLYRADRQLICLVYADGHWAVEGPNRDQQPASFAANGRELSLLPAMRRALRVAEALGWVFE